MSNGSKSTNVVQPSLTKTLQHFAGPLASARVWQNKRDEIRAIISCTGCIGLNPSKPHMAWTTRSDGGHGPGSSVAFALDMWAEHLDKRHEGQSCMWSNDPKRGTALAEFRANEAPFYAASPNSYPRRT